MVLKFDEYIYKKDITIEAKGQALDISVCITDEEGAEITALMVEDKDDKLGRIILKDDYDRIRKVLVGFNYNKFKMIVLKDFMDFMTGLTLEVLTKKQG